MKSKIVNILNEIRPEFDFSEAGINFVEAGMLDSFDIVTLVTSLDEEFGISIDGIDILPEMIEGAKSKFNYIEDRFECIDVFDYYDSHDYVVSVGTISTRIFEDDEEQKSFGFNFIFSM